MRRASSLLVAVAVTATLVAVPLPALALSVPGTLASRAGLGDLSGPSAPVDPAFPVDFLTVSWTAGEEPSVRFLVSGEWTKWAIAHGDGLPDVAGRTFSALLDGDDADAYQVRGDATDVRALAINTTDGPRAVTWRTLEPVASAGPQPPVVSRPMWGADESYRFRADGRPKGIPSFYPTQKLIVHHTVTSNLDADPAATVRAIYYDHVMNRGFQDIAYNFLVDAAGRIYKGRYSGPAGTRDQDTLTGEDTSGRGVTGAHTGGWNSGTMGIALLGTFTSVPPTQPARQALIDHLAWESTRHGLDPLATTTFTHPETGAKKAAPNITGHRDWGSTECPGGVLYADLPAIRSEVAAKASGMDTKPPRIRKIKVDASRRSAVITWRTNEPSDSQVRYRVKGKPWRTLVRPAAVEEHRVRLKGLKRERTYWYRVGSADAAGNDAWSSRSTFTTAA